MIRLFTFVAVLVLVGACLVEESHARRTWSRGGRYSFGGARPVSGYGSNIHRNFILKQEAKRASQGLRVRNRGNIIWYRGSR